VSWEWPINSSRQQRRRLFIPTRYPGSCGNSGRQPARGAVAHPVPLEAGTNVPVMTQMKPLEQIQLTTDQGEVFPAGFGGCLIRYVVEEITGQVGREDRQHTRWSVRCQVAAATAQGTGRPGSIGEGIIPMHGGLPPASKLDSLVSVIEQETHTVISFELLDLSGSGVRMKPQGPGLGIDRAQDDGTNLRHAARSVGSYGGLVPAMATFPASQAVSRSESSSGGSFRVVLAEVSGSMIRA
jgi:hypothetical protein